MFSKALKYELPLRIISAFKSVNHFSFPSLPKIIFSLKINTVITTALTEASSR